MIIVGWRIAGKKRLDFAFTGEGLKLYGGRWNSKGHKAVYLADSPALAALEIMVHAVDFLILKGYYVFRVKIPQKLITELNISKLPKNWQGDPPPLELQKIGDNWIDEKKSAVLKVPSAVVPLEFNFIVNPEHPDFKKITVEDPLPFLSQPSFHYSIIPDELFNGIAKEL